MHRFMKAAVFTAAATTSIAAIAQTRSISRSGAEAAGTSNMGIARSLYAPNLLKQQRTGEQNQPTFVGDFDIANWTLVNTPVDTGGSFSTQAGPPIQLFVVGGDNQSGNAGDTDFQITIPADGTLTFDWGFQSDDIKCFDSGGYVIDGVYTELACTTLLVPFFTESATVPVSQGDTFAFRMHTADGLFGSATLGVTNFQFLPLGNPEIAIDPTSLSFSAPQDELDSATLDITNDGTGTLTWTIAVVADQGPTSCADAAPAAWLSAEPSLGNTAGGSSSAVQVDADATGLAVGNYAAVLCIDSNDGVGNAHLEAPVDFEVTIGDAIFASDFECESGLEGCPGGGTPGIYTNRDEFLANVATGFYEEGFATVPSGSPVASLDFSGNGFAYTLTSVGPSANPTLYNNPGIISHNFASDNLTVTFTGASVTAVGGNFWASDVNVAPNGGEITVMLSDGTQQTFTSTGSSDFLGFVTKAPIVSFTIDASDVDFFSWSTMDNLIVGQIAD